MSASRTTVVRTAAVALAATGLLSLTQPAPGSAAVAPTATTASAPIGTSDLLQSQDVGGLSEQLGELDRQRTDLFGARSVSACTGAAGFDTVTGDKTLVSLGSRWDNAEGERAGLVTEAIARADSPAAARRAALRTLAALVPCQQRGGAWHYGQVYGGPLRDRGHVWLDRLDRCGQAVGGVAVMLQGDRFGVVEVSGSIGDGDDAVKDLVLPAEDRLA